MREWLLAHDIEHTTTAADESAGNGRAESEIAHLKHHTKLLLNTSSTPRQYWVQAKSKFWHRSVHGFSYTYAEGQSVGTCGWDESEVDGINSGCSTWSETYTSTRISDG